jgi:HK97 gp10 family phage protein
MNVRFEIHGAAVAEAFQRIERTVERTLPKAFYRAGALVEREAKKEAHVGVSGDLRRSLTTEVREYGGLRFEAVVGSKLKYAPWQEFGTRAHYAPIVTRDRKELTALGLWMKRKLGIPEKDLKKRRPYIWVEGDAHPFLIPAYKANLPKCIEIITKAVGEALQ